MSRSVSLRTTATLPRKGLSVRYAERGMVTTAGILHREPGRALRFTAVDDFHLLEEIPGLVF